MPRHGIRTRETTAWFTFYQDYTSQTIKTNGTLRIVNREGTTTIYLNNAPAGNFSNPDSFRAGTPIEVSKVHQQVVIDTVTAGFTAVNQDTVTSTTAFSVNGQLVQIGKVGDVIRTSRTGRLTGTLGAFGGYSVGAQSASPQQRSHENG